MFDKVKSTPATRSRATVHNGGATSTSEMPARTITPAWALQHHSDPKPREMIASLITSQPHSDSSAFAPLMTISETARIFHVAPRTVRRMIRRDELHAVRIGRSIRIRAEEISRLALGTARVEFPT